MVKRKKRENIGLVLCFGFFDNPIIENSIKYSVAASPTAH